MNYWILNVCMKLFWCGIKRLNSQEESYDLMITQGSIQLLYWNNHCVQLISLVRINVSSTLDFQLFYSRWNICN